jgi:hypothetical protein
MRINRRLIAAVAAGLRRGWGRPIAAILILVTSGIVALVVVAGGMFSDWSDPGSNIPVPYLVGAIAAMAVGVLIAGRVLLGGAKTDGRIRGSSRPSVADG